MKRIVSWRLAVSAMLLLLGLAPFGCATGTTPGDPYESFNRTMFGFNTAVDKHLGKPLADAYTAVVPEPARTALGNAFDNLGYGNVIVNDILQGKFFQGLQDLTRMAINSTLGIGGLFDVATGLGLPAHDEDFGQTLAVWGFEPGAYLVLPLLGPTTVRDSPGYAVQAVTNPLFYVDEAAATIPVGVVNGIDVRARHDDDIRRMNESATDRYIFMRDAYLQHRLFLIYDGSPPIPDEDDLLPPEPDTIDAPAPSPSDAQDNDDGGSDESDPDDS